jgi:hypothetical protein
MVEKMGNLASDRLNPLFIIFSLTARVFFTGAWCRVAAFDGKDSVGHLHLLCSGRISVKNRCADSIYVDQPSVLFYPRPCPHALLPEEGTEIDLVCASLEFGDWVGSPLSLVLPEMVILPLDSIKTMAPSLELLFSEAFTDQFGRQTALDRLAGCFVIQLLLHISQTRCNVFITTTEESAPMHAIRTVSSQQHRVQKNELGY